MADPVRLEVLHLLSEIEWATAAKIGERCQTSPATLRRHLEAMVAVGLLHERPGESDGATPGRPAALFGLLPTIRDRVTAALRGGA